jgi:hypothetical protein
VVRLRQKNHRAAWQLFAATGWDTDPPQHIVHRISAVYALALRELQTLDIEDNQEAAREGRALGVFGAARASLV